MREGWVRGLVAEGAWFGRQGRTGKSLCGLDLAANSRRHSLDPQKRSGLTGSGRYGGGAEALGGSAAVHKPRLLSLYYSGQRNQQRPNNGK